LTYLGALKSWLCWGVLRAFGPNLWSIRVPALLGGAITVWLLFLLMERLHSRRAAWVAAALLATDTCFVLTTCFDWGPVMLQHLLLTAALLLGIDFYRRGDNRLLGGCSFFAGLALWDKALALWMLSGLLLALTLLCRRELAWLFTRRRALVALVWLVIGSSPLLVYNVRHGLITFRANTHLDFSEIPHKIHLMRLTIAGNALFGYLVNYSSAPDARTPASGVGYAAARIHQLTGDRETSWMLPAWGAAGILSVWMLFTPARRVLLFCLIAFGIAWAQMLITSGAGGSVHHTILLWPLPEIFIGVTFAEASRRLGHAGVPVLAVVVVALAAANLANVNQYVYQFARFGATKFWTDAMDALPAELEATHAREICIIDWGIYDALLALTSGRAPVEFVSGPFTDPVFTPEDRDQVLGMLSEPGLLFLAHTDDQQIFQGVNPRLEHAARDLGFHSSRLFVWPDGNGRPMYEAVSFSR
jgi:4-amino-4-deoxy-L-arabinose transferase-like glycosyltransferase